MLSAQLGISNQLKKDSDNILVIRKIKRGLTTKKIKSRDGISSPEDGEFAKALESVLNLILGLPWVNFDLMTFSLNVMNLDAIKPLDVGDTFFFDPTGIGSKLGFEKKYPKWMFTMEEINGNKVLCVAIWNGNKFVPIIELSVFIMSEGKNILAAESEVFEDYLFDKRDYKGFKLDDSILNRYTRSIDNAIRDFMREINNMGVVASKEIIKDRNLKRRLELELMDVIFNELKIERTDENWQNVTFLLNLVSSRVTGDIKQLDGSLITMDDLVPKS